MRLLLAGVEVNRELLDGRALGGFPLGGTSDVNQGRLGTKRMGQVRRARSALVCYRMATPVTPAGTTGPVQKGAVLSHPVSGVATGP